MRTERSNTKSTLNALPNPLIAIGKGKVEGEGSALSLQDVFSDSANHAGSHHKTSCLPENGHGKWVATPKNKRKKPSKIHERQGLGGRKKLPPSHLKNKKLQMHLTEEEHQKIHGLYMHSGQKTMSDFLRLLVLDGQKSRVIKNNVALIKHLDAIGHELGKIGTNINQLAKYANIQLKSGKVDARTMGRFEEQMDKYLQEKQELAKAYRALVRNEPATLDRTVS